NVSQSNSRPRSVSVRKSGSQTRQPMSHRRAARTCCISRSVQSIDTVAKRNNRPDDLLDHHAIVVLLAVGQFIIGNEGRMGLDLTVASRAVLPTTLHALLCPVGRELLDQPPLRVVQWTVDVSIGLGVYVATLGTPAGCVRLCCLAGEWTQSNLWVNGGI